VVRSRTLLHSRLGPLNVKEIGPGTGRPSIRAWPGVVRSHRDVYMVRKQLYIGDGHERALKARARELGLGDPRAGSADAGWFAAGRGGGRGLAGAGAAEAPEGFLEGANQLAVYHGFPEGYRLDRKEHYEHRV
jgi:hypothetical protein